jgi:hypothetical protein
MNNRRKRVQPAQLRVPRHVSAGVDQDQSANAGDEQREQQAQPVEVE